VTDRADGRVGPNAILQSRAALEALGGADLAGQVFAEAGLAAMLGAPPAGMVAEADAAALHRAIVRVLPPDGALAVARDAGTRTGRYILAHRIPAPVRALLRVLPGPLSSRLLLMAIERHAWTFAGTGRVRARPGRPMVIEIAGNPLATPGCPWHVAVFETLFRALVAPGARVTHPECGARGGALCRFEIARR